MNYICLTRTKHTLTQSICVCTLENKWRNVLSLPHASTMRLNNYNGGLCTATTNGRFYCLSKDHKDYRNWNHHLTRVVMAIRNKSHFEWPKKNISNWICTQKSRFFHPLPFCIVSEKKKNGQTTIVIPFIFFCCCSGWFECAKCVNSVALLVVCPILQKMYIESVNHRNSTLCTMDKCWCCIFANRMVTNSVVQMLQLFFGVFRTNGTINQSDKDNNCAMHKICEYTQYTQCQSCRHQLQIDGNCSGWRCRCFLCFHSLVRCSFCTEMRTSKWS